MRKADRQPLGTWLAKCKTPEREFWIRETGMKLSDRGCQATIAGIALISAIALGSIANAGEISNGVVKIGVITDASGPLSDSNGQGSLIAAKLAAEDFQKQNPDIKVEVLFADHQNKPDIGSAIVRKWFDIDGVDAIADVGNSAVGLALQTIIRDKNKIAIYSSVATTALTGKQCVKTGFAWLHDAYTLVAGPLKTLVGQGQANWFFVAADYEFGKNMVAESQRLLQRFGGKSLGAVYHPMTNADYSSFLLQAQGSGANVVAFSNVGDQLVNSLKQWKEFGMDAGKQRPVAQLLFLTDVNSMGLDVATGLTSMVGWYWGLNDETKAFGHRFFERHQRMPTEPQGAVYSGVFHYLKGVAATGSDDTDTVAHWMRENAVDDFYARGAKIREDGKLLHNFYLIEVKNKTDVKEPWDYYKVLRTVPPDEAFIPLSESECPLVKASK
jgi:branched-chain amino acid transport system substrate-binding protein